MEIRKIFAPSIFILLLLTLLTTYLVQTHLMLNCDLSWLMLAAQRFFEGGTYTHDFLEPNPPLILFLSLPPVIINHLFALNMVILERLYIVFLALFSFAICYPLIKIVFRNNILSMQWFCAFLLFVFLLLPLGDFGQREHIIILFCMPYLLAVTAQLQNNPLTRSQAITIGLLAAMGFAIKPFYLSCLIAVEFYFLLQKKKMTNLFRPETWTIGVFLLVYAVIIAAFFKDYVLFIVPYAVRYYYPGYTSTLSTMLGTPSLWFFVLMLIPLILKQRQNANPHLIAIFIIAFISFTGCYLWQMGVTFYKFIPVLSMGFLLLGLLAYQYTAEACSGKLNYNYTVLFGASLLIFLVTQISSLWTAVVLYQLQFYLFAVLLSFGMIYTVSYPERSGFLKSILRTLFILGSGYLFSAAIRVTDWYPHHFSLTLLFMTLLFALCIPSYAQSKKSLIAVFILNSLIFAYPAFYLVHRFYYDDMSYSVRKNVINFLKKENVHDPVYFFSTATIYTFPVLDYVNIKNASRAPFFWMLPGMLLKEKQHAQDAQIKKDKAFLVKMIAEDLTRNKPELIFVDIRNRYIHTGNFSYIDYFLNDPAIKPIWGQYQYLTTLTYQPFYHFNVYRRIPQSLALRKI